MVLQEVVGTAIHSLNIFKRVPVQMWQRKTGSPSNLLKSFFKANLEGVETKELKFCESKKILTKTFVIFVTVYEHEWPFSLLDMATLSRRDRNDSS